MLSQWNILFSNEKKQTADGCSDINEPKNVLCEGARHERLYTV